MFNRGRDEEIQIVITLLTPFRVLKQAVGKIWIMGEALACAGSIPQNRRIKIDGGGGKYSVDIFFRKDHPHDENKAM